MAKSREETEHQYNPVTGGRASPEPPTARRAQEPMTSEQANLLRALSEKADEPFDPTLDRSQAGSRIRELRTLVGPIHRE